MSKVPCLGCGTPTHGSRCQACAINRSSRKSSEHSRAYDHAWRKLRLRILDRDHWTCYLCAKKLIGFDATVDHLIPLAIAPDLRLEPANLAACCRKCNSTKANR
jgi:5-methylcytosine-specific restriction endonuclease McrA